MERLEVVELFAGAGELDRLAGDFAETERRAAARVAIELGQDRAGDAQCLVKMRGDADRLLPGGGVEHEQDFARLNPVAKLDEFLHQRLVDLQPAGGVENDHVNAVRLGLGHRAVGDLEHVLFAAHQETRQIKLPGQGLDLVHRGGPVNVRADEQRFAILGGEQAGELAAGGGFAGAVQAAHHQAERLCEAARQVEFAALGAEQRDHLVADDFDDLLSGLDAGDDLLAERFLLHAGDELLGDLEINVRIEQGHAHLAQRLGDVGFADFAESPEVAEGLLEFIAERVKHGRGR